MLNEQASSTSDPFMYLVPEDDYTPDPFRELRTKVSEFMMITDEWQPSDYALNEVMLTLPSQQHLVSFSGKLLTDSEYAYEKLDEMLAPDNQLAIFRYNPDTSETNAPHEIHILAGRITPVEGRPWVNLLLFILTTLSVFLAGASYGIAGLDPDVARSLLLEVVVGGETLLIMPKLTEIWRGYPYALSLMLILGAHELGHYFAARYHGHSVSLPYFIPLPFVGLGTMGAVIRSREPMKNRKVLIDVGAAGPLAGLVFAIPILIIGLATSNIEAISGGGLREGNSLIYALLKIIALGQFYPTATEDVVINQMAFAGWLGLFVTALNLIPVGQLDGGHVMYSLFGMKARRVFYPVLLAMIVLAVFSSMWVLWVVLLLLLGRLYAPPLDDITPLDPRRRLLAVSTLLVFLLVFVPIPFTPIPNPDGQPAPENTVELHQPIDDTLLILGERD